MPVKKSILTIDDVKEVFANEFYLIQDKFRVLDIPVSEAKGNKDQKINSPGVYVHWHPQFGVVRVGKSQTNSKSRSFDHFRDGTKSDECDMSQLGVDPNSHLILFNIRSEDDSHWILSVENYLEKQLQPAIPPGRKG